MTEVFGLAPLVQPDVESVESDLVRGRLRRPAVDAHRGVHSHRITPGFLVSLTFVRFYGVFIRTTVQTRMDVS